MRLGLFQIGQVDKFKKIASKTGFGLNLIVAPTPNEVQAFRWK